MNENRFFPTPQEVGYGNFNKPQLAALTFVRDQIEAGNYEFPTPKYEVAQYIDLVQKILNQSNWSLQKNETTWTVKPRI